MSRQRILRIGLTGGVASGKSTVAEMFAELGVPVVDTDVIAREVVEPGTPALDEIRETFGDEVIAADGSLDRTAMRGIVFADDAAREALEAIVHPRIRAETIAQATAAGGEYQLIVVPLLVESPLRSFVDRVLVVDCSEETQVIRLLARDAGSDGQARRMLAAQASREARLAIADDVIGNEGDLGDTRRQVLQLHENYLEAARGQ
jgi:dephospho-CoA kinase